METWDFNYGEPFTERQQEVIADVVSNPLLSGISLLGGDPFFSAGKLPAFLDRLTAAAGEEVNCWVYSGFTFEQLAADPASSRYELLRRCHVLVDGRYEQAQRDVSLLYRGSSNQRIIRIQESLEQGHMCFMGAFDYIPFCAVP